MAFNRVKLGTGNGTGSNTPAIYTYITTGDNKAAVIADDYFLNAYQMLNVGDIIFAVASDDTVGLVVTASSSSTVTTDYIAVS